MPRSLSIFLLVFIAVAVLLSSLPAQDDSHPALRVELSERRIAYRDALQKVVNVMRARYQDGTDNIDGLIKAQIELGNAELAITSDPRKRIEKLKQNLDDLRKLEEYQKARHEVGAGREDEMLKSAAGRILGEIMLLEEQERQTR